MQAEKKEECIMEDEYIIMSARQLRCLAGCLFLYYAYKESLLQAEKKENELWKMSI